MYQSIPSTFLLKYISIIGFYWDLPLFKPIFLFFSLQRSFNNGCTTTFLSEKTLTTWLFILSVDVYSVGIYLQDYEAFYHLKNREGPLSEFLSEYIPDYYWIYSWILSWAKWVNFRRFYMRIFQALTYLFPMHPFSTSWKHRGRESVHWEQMG